MLDHYLEPVIQNKIKLTSALFMEGSISREALSRILPIGTAGVNTLVDELKKELSGLAEILRDPHTVSLSADSKVHFFHLFRMICGNSSVLHCLRFLLCNDGKRPFTQFVDEEYLTRSSAYRIRQNCQDYLRDTGLDLSENRVVGEEHRIRFLMALLHYKYGIDCYEMEPKDIQAIRHFILETNRVIDHIYLEQTEHEYGYFEYLLFLAWKRQRYPVSPVVSEQLHTLKGLFPYDAIKKALQKTLEPACSLTFSDSDYDYIYLAYCSTNNCLFADQWTDHDIEQIQAIILAAPEFADLLNRFGKRFGLMVQNSHALQTAIFYFCKKCLLELQCIIPDKNFFTGLPDRPLNVELRTMLAELLNQWREDNNIRYRIDSNHLIYLSIQFECILRQFMEPAKIVLLSDLTSELEAMELFLTRNFSPKRITVASFLLNAQLWKPLFDLRDCVIISHKKFEGVLTSMGLDRQNTLILVTAEMHDSGITALQNAIAANENTRFAQLLKESYKRESR